MKEFKCYDCDETFQAADRDDVLHQLHAHYMDMHKDIILGASKETKKQWMKEFEKDWTAAPEIS